MSLRVILVTIGIALFLHIVPFNTHSAWGQQIQPTINLKDLNKAELALNNWHGRLDEIDSFFSNTGLNDADLSISRNELVTIETELQKFVKEALPGLNQIKAQIQKLGPPPTKASPSESASAATERKQLNEQLAKLQGAIKRAEVLIVRSEQLHQITRERRWALFSENLFKYSASPLMPGLRGTAITGFGNTMDRFQALLKSWWDKVPEKQNIYMLAILSIAIWIGSTLFSQRYLYKFRLHEAGSPDHDFLSKAASALLATFLRAAPTIIGLTFLYQGLAAMDVLPPSEKSMVFSATVALGQFAVIVSLACSLFALKNPQWRIFSTTDKSSKRLFWLTVGIALLYSLEQITDAIYRYALAPLSVPIIQNCIISLMFGVLLIGILKTPWQKDHSNSTVSLAISFPIINNIVWLLPAAIIIASLGGYIAFAQFLTTQIVITGSILIASYLTYLTINSFTQSLTDSKTAVGRLIADNSFIKDKGTLLLSIAVNAILKFLLVAFSLPAILLQWGFNRDDLRDWLSYTVDDINVGEFKISVMGIFVASLLFIVGLVLTRFTQKWIERNLNQSHSARKSGVSDSVRKGLGYLGFVLSALVAVSYLGVNFTNLAIIAGALSVGIGFGLQSIANNFVSGIILLIERPVKVGDWIVVGEDQGYVRRINVRSTEIETFDRSNLIVPNSDLITGTVKNWTHRNSLGRVVIDVGVSYNSDPQRVYDLLLDVARSHSDVVDRPEPRVVFENFGESSLDFSVRVYVRDIVQSGLVVRTELRIKIFEAFRREGIEIPYPQRDLHIKQTSSPPNKRFTNSKVLEFIGDQKS